MFEEMNILMEKWQFLSGLFHPELRKVSRLGWVRFVPLSKMKLMTIVLLFKKSSIRVLSQFVIMLLIYSASYAQDSTIVPVFTGNFIHFGDPTLYETEDVKAEQGGRIIRRTLEIPEFTEPVRITAHLIIRSTINNCDQATGDPWDRAGTVMLSVPGMANIELLKFITGFGGYSDLKQDISNLAPLLHGSITIKGFVDTWVSPAWEMDFELIFKKASDVRNPSWNNGLLYLTGLKRDDVTDTEPAVDVNIPQNAEKVVLTYFTSGHAINGQDDEFTTRDNVIYVDGQEVHRYRPWRDDCRNFRSRNPCSGRWGTTWSSDFPRSGWCPGDIVYPVVLDVTNFLSAGHHNIRFAIENIRKDASGFGYWRVSSYLAGWGDISNWQANRLDMTGPGNLIISPNTVVAFRLDLSDDTGYPVITANAQVQIGSDSTGPVFSVDRETWTNPLSVQIEHGSLQFWMKSDKPGNFKIHAEGIGDAVSLSQPEDIEITVYDFEVKDEQNYALSATASADCECNSLTETAQHAIDGSLATKWCCNNGSPDWLLVTLPDSTELNYFIVRHAGAGQAPPGDPGAGDGPSMNTTDFSIQIKDSTGKFVNIIEVKNNPGSELGNVTYHELKKPVTVKEVRLFISDPGNDNASRIYEFEMYKRNFTSVAEPGTHRELQPGTLILSPNYPNPFNQDTQFKLFVPENRRVIATVMNSRGQVIASVLNSDLPGGIHVFSWNGKNLSGREVASGVYFLSVKSMEPTGKKTHTIQKMLYIR